MNEEIKQLIELQINARIIENRSNYALFNEGMRKGSEIAKEIILSKWQEANRWRKVSEELPENQDIVLVKTNKGCFATAYHHGKESGFIIYGDEAYREFGEVTEWKPIE